MGIAEKVLSEIENKIERGEVPPFIVGRDRGEF